MSLFDKVLHKTKSRPPPELVAKTVQACERLSEGSLSEKLLEEVARYLAQMKALLFGAADSEASRCGSDPRLRYAGARFCLLAQCYSRGRCSTLGLLTTGWPGGGAQGPGHPAGV